MSGSEPPGRLAFGACFIQFRRSCPSACRLPRSCRGAMRERLPDMDACAGSTDEDLALAVLRGDERAFQTLYARHRRDVHAFVTKRIGADPDREDVIQDVFLQLYRALPGFRGDASLSTFLRRITMNVAFDHLRRRCRHQRVDYDSEALDAAVDARQDPEQHSSARQQLQSLLHHLDGMALDKRRALMLVAVAGLSLNAAAAQLGTNVDRVKQRVVRARRELTAMTARSHASQAPRRADSV
jgi:RNA polymerase sigma-70 factor (ECF subfamily)